MAKLICAYCGAEAESLHRDHVVPRSRGGSDNATNIVMACQACNSAKGDQLPSEWLGERCPSSVLMIEIREHARLKKDFSVRRDRKPPTEPPAPTSPELYCYSLRDDGAVGYIGVVIEESATRVRLEAADALNFWLGIWDLSGQIYDLPRDKVTLWNDRECMIRKIDVLYRQWDKK